MTRAVPPGHEALLLPLSLLQSGGPAVNAYCLSMGDAFCTSIWKWRRRRTPINAHGVSTPFAEKTERPPEGTSQPGLICKKSCVRSDVYFLFCLLGSLSGDRTQSLALHHQGAPSSGTFRPQAPPPPPFAAPSPPRRFSRGSEQLRAR